MSENDPLEESRKITEEFENLLKNEENIVKDGKWSESLETLLKSWSERAAGYRWMHEKCSNVHKKYRGI